jgi:CheY-like chemotaxis protein
MHRILLAEDNEMNRDMLTRRLERRGYTIVHAHDGVEAVLKAQQERPDLILMDMSLPLLDGWDATRQIKADPATRYIPVLGLSAHAMNTDSARALEAGCDDYDTKPVDINRLCGKIEALLGQASGGPPQNSTGQQQSKCV